MRRFTKQQFDAIANGFIRSNSRNEFQNFRFICKCLSMYYLSRLHIQGSSGSKISSMHKYNFVNIANMGIDQAISVIYQ